jgi:hypothetical protein
MSKRHQQRSALYGLAAAALAVSCGSPVSPPAYSSGDPYNGVIDGTVLDAKFQGNTDRTLCQGQAPCYAPQLGYVGGATIYFYNVTAVQTSTLPATLGPAQAARGLDQSGGFRVDSFRGASCTPGPAYDPVHDAFPTDRQAPVVDALATKPTSSTGMSLPFAAVSDVAGTSGQCNDLKTRDSIADPGGVGLDGATRASSPSYEVWLQMDPSAAFFDLTNKPAAMPMGWFRGLQLGLIGGRPSRIPQDASGSFVFMEGAIVNPSATKFAQPTDARAVVLPFPAGDPKFSPLVHLHNFALPPGKKLGDYAGICQAGQTCPASYIKTSDFGAAFNTIFIIPSVQ